MVGADEAGQGLIHHPGEGLPAVILGAGEGDEILGEVDAVAPVGGHKLVVGHRLGLLHLGRLAGHRGDLHRQLILPPEVLGEHIADGLLELRRFVGGDGENGGKPQLTDDLGQLGMAVNHALCLREHGKHSLLISFCYHTTFFRRCLPTNEKNAAPWSAAVHYAVFSFFLSFFSTYLPAVGLLPGMVSARLKPGIRNRAGYSVIHEAVSHRPGMSRLAR